MMYGGISKGISTRKQNNLLPGVSFAARMKAVGRPMRNAINVVDNAILTLRPKSMNCRVSIRTDITADGCANRCMMNWASMYPTGAIEVSINIVSATRYRNRGCL